MKFRIPIAFFVSTPNKIFPLASKRTWRGMIPVFPKFDVQTIADLDKNLRLIGSIDHVNVGTSTWVGDGYLGYLFQERPIYYGRWHACGNTWEFAVSRTIDVMVRPFRGQTFSVLDGYWGERAEIILDETLAWTEQCYEEPDDHTHCDICWATIQPDENSRFMTSSANDELCMACYSKYVGPRSLAFISELSGSNL